MRAGGTRSGSWPENRRVKSCPTTNKNNDLAKQGSAVFLCPKQAVQEIFTHHSLIVNLMARADELREPFESILPSPVVPTMRWAAKPRKRGRKMLPADLGPGKSTASRTTAPKPQSQDPERPRVSAIFPASTKKKTTGIRIRKASSPASPVRSFFAMSGAICGIAPRSSQCAGTPRMTFFDV